MKKMKKMVKKGQSLVEYGLILALVSIVAIAVLNTMGGKIKSTVENVNDALDEAVTLSGQATGE
ncbi:MAG: Flp family type IVb pilin [Candidatus Gastranaerophilales bacterium]|nr:Flp family type IVb pilin [Candidatus Gastranaerophilales bacterium]